MSDRTGLKSPRFPRFCDVRPGLSKGEVGIDEAVKRHVGTADAVRRGKPADSNSRSELIFPVGVALTKANAIVFFRIQHQLCSMGLGPEVLKKLHQTNYDALNIGKDSAHAERIKYLFYSIKGSK